MNLETFSFEHKRFQIHSFTFEMFSFYFHVSRFIVSNKAFITLDNIRLQGYDG